MWRMKDTSLELGSYLTKSRFSRNNQFSNPSLKSEPSNIFKPHSRATKMKLRRENAFLRTQFEESLGWKNKYYTQVDKEQRHKNKFYQQLTSVFECHAKIMTWLASIQRKNVGCRILWIRFRKKLEDEKKSESGCIISKRWKFQTSSKHSRNHHQKPKKNAKTLSHERYLKLVCKILQTKCPLS